LFRWRKNSRRSKSRRGNRACPRSLQKSCGTGGGEAGARAFAPLSYTLQAIQAGLTLTASLQRGEPADVAVVRSVAPLVGSGLGGLGGGAIGGFLGGLAGSEVPVAGNTVGAIAHLSRAVSSCAIDYSSEPWDIR